MKQKKYKGKILLGLALIFSLGVGVVFGFIGGLVKSQPLLSFEEMHEQINDISENSDVYFGSGEKLGTINSELIRKSISFDEMGDNVKNAIIASEDANFYSNSGIEVLSIAKALYSEMSGKSNTGGSTITQQLVKNQLLDNTHSYERKAKEILLSLRVTNSFTKREILETYLNVASFGKNSLGQNISGIESASQGVFGKHAKELNIAQAAYLMGFVQSPFKYTPFDEKGNIKSDSELQLGFARQQYVLKRMVKLGYITKDDYNEALHFDIKGAFIKQKSTEYTNYPYIRDEITTSAAEILAEQTAKKNNELEKFKTNSTYREELIEKSRIKFITGGYKVKTTVDKKLYDTLNNAKNTFKSYPSARNGGVTYPMEIGASVIENNTGKILAFIGGVDYNKQQLNHATRTFRSPGSSIKPLLVYGPAIDKGYITPNSTVLDKRFNYNGWKPENFNRTEYGYIPAKEALARSLNLSTVRLYSAFVNENPVEQYLERMNFKKMDEGDKKNLAAAIGGLSHGVSVTENTNAFATFANNGKYKKSYIIDEIRNNKDELIYSSNFTPVKIYEESTSYLIVKMLNNVINASYGTSVDIGKNLKFNNKNLFVKTGTSEYYNDLWVVGGTKNITVGLWAGYDKPTTVPSYDYAHKAWTHVMNAIYDYSNKLVSPDTEFEKPSSVIDSDINPYNNSKGNISDMIPKDFKELDKEKTLLKFGFNIDKTLTFRTPSKPKEKDKDDDKDKEDKDNQTSDAVESQNPSSREDDDHE
ncbi:transglycosylase domain-containing protein [Gemella bergeri]